MAHWESNYSNYFETEEEARNDAIETMTETEFYDYLSMAISFRELLAWAIKKDDFYDEFGDAVDEAEEEYFQDWYKKVDDNDE